jgi:RNA polymerase sigma-70 factor (ECF subfamily)
MPDDPFRKSGTFFRPSIVLVDEEDKGLTATVEQEAYLEQAKAGDKSAFGALVGEYSDLVYSIAFHFHGRAALAEDIAQDIFLELYRNLGKIASAPHLVSWLRRSTTNRCIDQGRKASYRTEVSLEGAPEQGRPPVLTDGLLNEKLRKQVAALPEWQRAVVVLRYQEDMDPAEIADTLRIPLNTVKSRLHRAIGTLREKMERTQQARI